MKKFPEVKEGDSIVVNEIVSEEKETKPPARYNQASLIKELEKGNLELKLPVQILLISYMTENTYLEIKFEVNQLGENIIDTLSEYCSNLTSERVNS